MSANSLAAAVSQERRYSRKLMWLVCITTTLATILALFSRWHWFAELFAHFRLYYLLAQAVLLMVFLNTQRYAWLVATFLLALPNAWYVMPYLLPLLPSQTQAVAQPEAPQIIVINLSYRNTQSERVLGYLQDQQPALLIFSEYTPAWDAVLADRMTDYPHRLIRPRVDPFGMAVFSRQPLARAASLDLGTPGAENIQLRTRIGGRDLSIFAVHLFPPTSPTRSAAREQQLARLADAVAQSPPPRLITGDLNLTPFSPYFHTLLADSGLLDARQAQGLHITWPSLPLPLWIPIDHALADPGSGVVDVRIGPAVGSDHYPLEIVLAEVR